MWQGVSYGGGVLVLAIYNRWQELRRDRLGKWTFRGQASLPDGTKLVKHVRIDGRSLIEQGLTKSVRYRRLRGREVLDEQLTHEEERWYFRHEMSLMLEHAGFQGIHVTGNYTDEPVADEHYVMTFFGVKGSA